jgi:hypothetical protein
MAAGAEVRRILEAAYGNGREDSTGGRKAAEEELRI